ncbi:MAG: hypothetical protein IJA79_02985 [Desulfovibrio sp.]|nr:hypothetical protein [Desulfovibrio sp.]
MKLWQNVFFATALMLVVLGLGIQDVALAADSGDERTIPVIRWECFSCDKQFFSFEPDDLAGKSKADNKDGKYQKANWGMLADINKAIPPCPMVGDGGHFLELKEKINTSAFIIRANIHQYIILKSGGGAIKAKFQRIKCTGCDMEGYCFAGDDLDLFGALTLNAAPDLYNLKTGQKNSACKVKLAPGYYLYVHMFEQKSVSNPSSLQLAQNLQYVWYSD